jgi:hypothetical protein
MKRVLRIVGIVLGSLLGILLLAGVVLYVMGNARLNKVYDFPASNLTLPQDAASIEYGKHRVETLCQGCHGEDLSGIDNFFSVGPLGTIDSANLTAGKAASGGNSQPKITCGRSATTSVRMGSLSLWRLLLPLRI